MSDGSGTAAVRQQCCSLCAEVLLTATISLPIQGFYSTL